MKRALGLIEISGPSAVVVTTNTMAKAANIRILKIENTKGLGYMTIRIAGDAGVVNAAIDAGKQIGAADNKLVPWKVISRPSGYVERTFCCPEPPVSPSPPMKEVQEETGTGKTGKTMREGPETAGEPEPDGGQANSMREEMDSKGEPQTEAGQPPEEEDFRLAEKPKKVSRHTPVTKDTGIARFKNG